MDDLFGDINIEKDAYNKGYRAGIEENRAYNKNKY